MSGYVPRRGSATEKALAYLREEGTTSSQELAEHIGQPRAALYNVLEFAVRNGAVERSKRDGKTWYSVGDGYGQAAVVDPEDVAPLPTRKEPRTAYVAIDRVLHGMAEVES